MLKQADLLSHNSMFLIFRSDIKFIWGSFKEQQVSDSKTSYELVNPKNQRKKFYSNTEVTAQDLGKHTKSFRSQKKDISLAVHMHCVQTKIF